MLLIPAIDLKNGKCVRLRQGRMDDETLFADDPVEMAGKWADAGCNRLHLIDLNGAFEGKPVNAEVIHQICETYPDIPIQVGGGIRTKDTVTAYLDAGAQFVIIGTQAIRAPHFITDLCNEFHGHIIMGLDARNGLIAVQGWAQITSNHAIDIARKFENEGISAIIYTDIARDGMMQGVNIEAVKTLAEAVAIPVIASGGVSRYADIRELQSISDSGIEGVVIGRALYEGAIDLKTAQEIINQPQETLDPATEQEIIAPLP